MMRVSTVPVLLLIHTRAGVDYLVDCGDIFVVFINIMLSLLDRAVLWRQQAMAGPVYRVLGGAERMCFCIYGTGSGI